MNISARNTQPTQTADALSYLFIYTSIELSEGGWFLFYQPPPPPRTGDKPISEQTVTEFIDAHAALGGDKLINSIRNFINNNSN